MITGKDSSLKSSLWIKFFILIAFIPYWATAGSGDDYANVRFISDHLKRDSGSFDIRMNFVDWHGNDEYLDYADIYYSVDGEEWEPFSYVRRHDYNLGYNPWGVTPLTLDTGDNAWDSEFYVYFKGEKGGSGGGINSNSNRTEYAIGINVFSLTAFQGKKTMRWKVKGKIAGESFESISHEIDISSEIDKDKGNDELQFSVVNSNSHLDNGVTIVGLNLEFLDNNDYYDHISGVQINASLDGDTEKFAYVRHQNLNINENPPGYTRISIGSETGTKDSYYLFLKEDEFTNNNTLVTYTLEKNSSRNRLLLSIPVKSLIRFSNVERLKFSSEGAFYERHRTETKSVLVSKEESEVIVISEEDNNGQDEILFNAFYSKDEGCAVLTLRLEKRYNEEVFDHLACLELGKRTVERDETIGYINHLAGELACNDLFGNPASSSTFKGSEGDTYKYGMKYNTLQVQQYDGNYYYDSNGDKILVIKDYISQEEFNKNIKYYVHGSYYERDLDGNGNKATFNWSENLSGGFVVSEEMNIPAIALTSVEASSTYNCQIDVSWSAPSSSFGGLESRNYVGVYRNNQIIAYVDVNSGVNVYQDTDIIPGETYNYQLALVYNRDFETNLEGQKSVAKSAKINLLEAPSGLSSTQVGCNGDIEITWNYNTNPQKFILEKKTINQEEFSQVGGYIDGSKRSYTDTDVEENKVYKYRISAISDVQKCSAQGVLSAVYTHSKDPVDVSSIFDQSNFLVETSKGYFNNRTELEWNPNENIEQYINQYKIYIREFGSLVKPKLLTTLGINTRRYNHTDGKAGAIYEYFIVGERVVETECGRQITASFSIESLDGKLTENVNISTGVAYNIGLRVATGVINGNISYSGGIAVPDVKVIAERDKDNIGKSLYFNGSSSYLEIPYDEKTAPIQEVTFSLWLKPEALNKYAVIAERQVSFGFQLSKDGEAVFYVKNDSGTFAQVKSPVGAITVGNWTNITGTFSTDQRLKIFVNGEKVGSKVLSGFEKLFTGNNEYPLSIGRQYSSKDYYYQGYLDDVRLYNKALTDDEVARNYGRYISNNTEGLVGYWKIFEGLGNYIFDLSNTKDVYHKNNGELFNVLFTDDIPTSTQLGSAGFTDAYGNYSIEAVEYSGVGESFNIIPTVTLGGAIHEFDPGRKTLFIGEGSKVNNDKDFEDVSSFQFSGYVRFDFDDNLEDGLDLRSSGSKDVSFYLDGETLVLGDNKKPYVSSDEGFFDIQIPIGHHFIEFRRNGHTFSNGRFPASGTHNFQKGITGLEILDTTKHKLAGRVVGGVVEGDKKLSMSHNPSVNNIGQATFTLTSEDGKIVRTIITDSQTGEYQVNLPPRKYTASSVKWVFDAIDIINSGDISRIDLTSNDSYIGTVEKDSVFTVENKFVRIDSTVYNLRKDFIYRSVPELVVTGVKGEPVKDTGEKYYTLKQGNTAKEINLSSLRYPVYVPKGYKKPYKLLLKSVEKYKNKDSNQEYFSAVSDGVVETYNGLGKGFYLDEAGKPIDYRNGDRLKLNESGELYYNFYVTEPNTNANLSLGLEHLSYTKQLGFVLDVNGEKVAWPNSLDVNERQNAYVFGIKALEENSFVTKAPTVVDFVLRDPPGSNSYAYLSKGNSITSTEETFNGDFHDFEGTASIGFGVNVSAFFVSASLEAYGTFGGTEQRHKEEGSSVESTITFNETIQTNNEPIQIGHSDVFVAKSENLKSGYSVQIRPIPVEECGDKCVGDVMSDDKGQEYRMGRVIQTFLNPEGQPTYFYFSQSHIENVLIPELEKLRNGLFNKPSSEYVSKLVLGHKNYGTNNDDPVWKGKGQTSTNYIKTEDGDFNGPSYKFSSRESEINKAIDSVRSYNQQIRLWKEALANNEIEKWIAKKASNKANVSIASGVSLERSTSTSVARTTYQSWEHTTSFVAQFDFESVGFTPTGTPFPSYFASHISNEWSKKKTEKSSNETENNRSIGYVLNDMDEDDFISVDIVDGAGNNGPVFITQGGKTMCPFEDKVVLKYTTSAYVEALITTEENDFNKLTAERQAASGAGLTAKVNNLDAQINRLGIDISNLRELLISINKGEVVLSNATLQRDKPAIEINGAKRAQAFNVSANEAANFNLSLINESQSEDAQYYAIKAIDETNPNGLEMTIDGQSINSSREFLVQGGGGIQKVLKVRRGPNHYDYKDVGVVIKSVCQANPTGNDAILSDTIYFDVAFLPICTPLEIKAPANNWTLNNSFKQADGSKKFPITVSGYDVNTVGFETIKIEYKTSFSSDWILLETYYRNEEVRTEKVGVDSKAPLLPTSGNSFTYNWVLGSTFTDGAYDLRAVSGCALAKTETDILTGIIDTKNPEPFGLPQPSDGVLSAGEEASIQFNETINANLLSAANFDVRGVLNAGEIRHDASVQFEGVDDSYLQVEKMNMASKPFSIEFYAKPTVLGVDQVMIGQGVDPLTEMNIGINSSNYFYFKLSGRTIVNSSISLEVDKWYHFAVTYDPLNTNVTLYVNAKNATIDNSFAVRNQLIEDLFIGKAATGKPFKGNIHEIRLWSGAITVDNVNVAATQRMVGNEPGLLHNWKMEEVYGSIAHDKVRAKHAEVYANWVVEPGGYALKLNGTANEALLDQSIAFDSKSDYTFSFWFKSNGGTDQVLMSNGKGDGTDDNVSGWSVGIDNAGLVYAQANGETLESTVLGVDSKWHHLAVVVRALGNAVLYIDGQEFGKIPGTNLLGFGGSRLALGQRVYESGSNLLQDKYFSGSIDEFRVWNIARTLEQISRDRYNQLSGDEIGLVAYYPFETYSESVFGLFSVVRNSDNHSGSSSKISEKFTLSDDVLNTDAARIKLKRPVESVNFSYVVNNDKVILTLNASLASIENVLLDFTAKGIKDENGNTVTSPITWSAYVDKNQVIWQENSFELETVNGRAIEFTSKIFNNSGESKIFEISNIPNWLEVTPTSGTVGPLTTVPISFKVFEDVNNGVYTQDILLATDFDFAEKLSLKVAVKEPLPDNWKINSDDFEYSMNVIGQISFNGVLSRDEGNVLGVFVGNECRGLVNLRYLSTYDNYQAFLPIYSNTASGENLEFKIWEASTGIIHTDITHDMSTSEFVPNLFEGTPLQPKVFAISNSVSGSIPVVDGWKWVSFNLTGNDLNSTNNLLDNLNPSDGDLIKTRLNVKQPDNSYIQTPMFDSYDAGSGSWFGTIAIRGAIAPGVLYKIKTSEANEIYYEGVVVNPLTHVLHTVKGWNYIGYTGTQKIPINEGLSNLHAVDGDLIKGQKFSAVYDTNYGWIGSLTVLQPGVGYMLYTNIAQDFTYPAFNSTSGSLGGVANLVSTTTPWRVNSSYENNMTMVVEIVEGGETGVLGAFVKGECRGVAKGVFNPVLNKTTYFINISGLVAKEEVLFKFKDGIEATVYEVNEKITYENDAVKGAVYKPVVFTLNKNKTKEKSNLINTELSIQPNPFVESLYISIPVVKEGVDCSYSLYNPSGQILRKSFIGSLSKGKHTVRIQRENLEAGIYYLELIVGSKTVVKKVIVKNN